MYLIQPYSYKQAKRLGVLIRPSESSNKKIDVFKHGDKVASIGDVRYADYPQYLKQDKGLAQERRRVYHARHRASGIKPNTPGWYSLNILW